MGVGSVYEGCRIADLDGPAAHAAEVLRNLPRPHTLVIHQSLSLPEPPRERVLYWQLTAPNPLHHRDLPRPHTRMSLRMVGGGVRIHLENSRTSGRHGVQYEAA